MERTAEATDEYTHLQELPLPILPLLLRRLPLASPLAAAAPPPAARCLALAVVLEPHSWRRALYMGGGYWRPALPLR